MKDDIIAVREVHVQLVRVTAVSLVDAIAAVEIGRGVELDNTLEFSHRLPVNTWTGEEAPHKE